MESTHTATTTKNNHTDVADNTELVSVNKLIEILKNGGIRIGRTGSDPYNTLRYYTKLGLLPRMVRKFSETDDSVVGHYPLSVVATIKTIESLKKQGLSNSEIYDHFAEEEMKAVERKNGIAHKQESLVSRVEVKPVVFPIQKMHGPRKVDETASTVEPVKKQSLGFTSLVFGLSMILLFITAGIVFLGLDATQVAKINTFTANFQSRFQENFVCNVSTHAANVLGIDCVGNRDLAHGDNGSVLADETRISLSEATFVEYEHAAVFSDYKYATMRLENFALEVNGEWVGPDFLVAQSRGQGVFYLQSGGDYWALGGGNVQWMIVRDELNVEGASTLATLSVLGPATFAKTIDVSGLSTLASTLTTGDAQFQGGIRVTDGDVVINGDLKVTGPQTFSGTGSLTLDPNGNLYFQSTNYYITESGNLVIGSLTTPFLTYEGDIIIDASSGTRNTTVTVSNPDAGYVANFSVEGDVSVHGGKITLADGETIDAETLDVITLTSDGDIAFVLGDELGSKELIIYDSSGVKRVFSVDSNGFTTIAGGAVVTGNFTMTGDVNVTGDSVFNGDTVFNGQLQVENYANLATIQALTQLGTGALVYNQDDDFLYYYKSDTEDWTVVGGGLQQAYNAGQSIALSATRGDLRITSSLAAEVLFLGESTGYVGVGTTDPQARLDVYGKTSTTTFQMTNGGVAGYVLVSDSSGNASWTDVSSTAGPWNLVGTNLSPDDISYNVGIGTTAPLAKLAVVGDSKFGDGGIANYAQFNATGDLSLFGSADTITGPGGLLTITNAGSQAISALGASSDLSLISGRNTTLTSGGYLDVNVTGDITLDGATFTLTPLGMFVLNATGATSIDSNSTLTMGGTAVSITSDSGTLTLNGDGTNDIDIVNAGGMIDMDSATLSILTSAGFGINGTANSNVTTTTGDLTLSTATSGNVLITSADGVTVSYDTTGGTFSLTDGTERIGIADNGNITIGDDGTITIFDGSNIVDATNAEAFLVRKNGDTADVFVIDTTLDGADAAAQLNTTSITSGSGFVINADALTSGDALVVKVDSDDITTGKAFNIYGGASLSTSVFSVNGGGDLLSAGNATFGNGTVTINTNTGTAGWINSDGSASFASGNLAIATTGNIQVQPGYGIDTNTGGALKIGQTNATAIDIGHAGAATSVTGASFTTTTTGAQQFTSGGVMSFSTLAANQNITFATGTADVNINSGQFIVDGNGDILLAPSSLLARINAITIDVSNQSTNVDIKDSIQNAFSVETNLLSFDTANARVGIGTTNPGATFDVLGNVILSGDDIGTQHIARLTDTGYLSLLGGSSYLTGAGIYLAGDSWAGAASLGVSDAAIVAGVGGNIRFQENGDDHMTVTSEGRVGIGTTAPASMLSVGSGSPFQVNSSGNIVRINDVAISFPSAQGVANSTLRNDGSGNLEWASPVGTGSIGFWTRTGTTLTPYTNTDTIATLGNVGVGTTNPVNALSVTGNANVTGNVGIGTTAPNAKLDVAGNMYPTTTLTHNIGSATYEWNNLYLGGTLDLGANTITDGTFAGNWAFSSGNLTGVGTIGSGAITSTGQVQGTTLTDGTASLTTGAFSGLASAAFGTGNLYLTGTTVGLSTDTDLLSLATNALTVNGTATIGTLNVGATDTVVTHSAGLLQTRTIDSRVWGSSLVDGSGTINYVARWSDANTVGIGTLYDTGTNVGIGTTAPSKQLEIAGTSAALRFSYNATNYATMSVDSNGGLTFVNTTGGTDTTTASINSTGATFNVPTTFASAGDVSIANDLSFTNGTASYINFNSPGYIRTNHPSGNYDLTLSAANSGVVYVDDNFTVAGNALPSVDATHNLGSALYRWNNVYANSFVGAITPTGFTQGSVAFAGSGGTLTQDNANFFWNDTTDRLGIGTIAPLSKLGVLGNASIGATYGAIAAPTSGLIIEGNVGIGTTGPSYKLDTSGIIRAWDLMTNNIVLSSGSATTLNAFTGHQGYVNTTGGIGTGGVIHLSENGNLKNIGSIQAGEIKLTSGGTFGSATNYNSSGTGPWGIASGDFNGDQKADLVAANDGTGDSVTVFINSGDGTFAAGVDYNSGGIDPLSIATGDVNGDGKADILIGLWGVGGGDGMSVLMNNGNGTFGAAVVYDMGSDSRGMNIGDVTGDGKLDVIATSDDDSNVAVFINHGDGTFANAVTYTAGTAPRGVMIKDLNADGKADMVVSNASSNNISVFINSGAGTFGAATNYASTGLGTQGGSVGDLDGDGKADIAVADYSSSKVSVFMGNGDGTFDLAVGYSTAGAPRTVVMEDVSGDGKLDLVTANRTADNLSVLINNGDGTFASAINYASGGTGTQWVTTADFNGDGKSDLAATNYISNNISVLMNNPSNMFFASASTGNVGIGTTGPGYKLDVAGDFRTTSSAWLGSGLTGQGLYVKSTGNVGIGTTAPGAKLAIESNSTNGWIKLTSTSGNPLIESANGLFIKSASTYQAFSSDNGIRLGNVNSGTGYGDVNIISGNVGIGTTSPGYKLEVAGDLRSTTGAYFATTSGNVGIGIVSPRAKLDVQNTNGSSIVVGRSQANDPVLSLQGYYPTVGFNYYNNTSANVYAASDAAFGLTQVMGSSRISFYTAPVGTAGNTPTLTERLALSAAGGLSLGSTYVGTDAGAGNMIIQGNVGIGTTAPGAKLEVFNGGDSIVTITGNSASGNNVGIDFKRNAGTVNASIYAASEINNDYNHLSFLTRGSGGYSERVRIDSTGNVGIGTTAPVSLLALQNTDGLNVGPTISLKSGELGVLANEVLGKLDFHSADSTLTVNTGAGYLQYVAEENVSTTRLNSRLEIATSNESTGPQVKMVIDKSGNVGIGTTSPGGRLALLGAGTTTGFTFRTQDSAGTDRFVIQDNGNVGIGTTAPGSRLVVKGSGATSATSALNVTNSSNVSALFVRNDGNVGIGTTGPGAKLDVFVDGTINAVVGIFGKVDSTGYWRIRNAGSPTTRRILEGYSGTTETIHLDPSSTSYLNGGNVGIGTTGPNVKLQVVGDVGIGADDSKIVYRTAGGTALTFFDGSAAESIYALDLRLGATYSTLDSNDPGNGGIYAAGILKVAGTGNSSIAGNVGIGTTGPGYKLDVNGNYSLGENSIVWNARSLYHTATDQYGVGQYASAASHFYLTNEGGTYRQALVLGDNAGSSTAFGFSTSSDSGSTWNPRFVIGQSGNVGIGTTEPASKLHVQGGDARIWGGSATDSFLQIGSEGALDESMNIKFVTSNNSLQIYGYGRSAGSGLNILSNSGNVGIGTTAPTSLLSLGSNAVISRGTSDGADNDVLKLSGGGLAAGSRGAVIQLFGNEHATSPGQLYLAGGESSYVAVNGGISAGSYYATTPPSNGMIISGNVGIGTTGPGAKLQVYGDGNSTIFGTGTLTDSYIAVRDIVNGAYFGIDASLNAGAGAVLIQGGNNKAIALDANTSAFGAGTPDVYINPSGNVGIGTTAPGDQLTLLAATDGSGIRLIGSQTATTKAVQYSLYDGSTQRSTFSLASVAGQYSTGATAGDIVLRANTGKLILQTGTGAASMTINSGNVGIGTTAPASLLSLYNTSTSTAFKGFNLDWQPTAATTLTGDLFGINIGANGNASSLFNITDNGTSLFKVTKTQITSAIPHAFTAAGDVDIASNLNLSNGTSASINSSGALTITSGDSYDNHDLTLKASGTGNVVIGSGFDTELYSGQRSVFDVDDSSDTYLSHSNTNNRLGVFVDGTERFRFTASGSNESAGAIATALSDVAENYPTMDSTLEPGEVVAIASPSENSGVSKSAYLVERTDSTNGDLAIGIVSSKPGVILGGGSFQDEFCTLVNSGVDGEAKAREQLNGEVTSNKGSVISNQVQDIGKQGTVTSDKVQGTSQDSTQSADATVASALDDRISTCKALKQVPVALSGRVPVKVDPSANIKAGDLLAPSKVLLGTATKATEAGFVIGRALEDAKCVTSNSESVTGNSDSKIQNSESKITSCTVMAFVMNSYYPGDLASGSTLVTGTGTIDTSKYADLTVTTSFISTGKTQLSNTIVAGDLTVSGDIANVFGDLTFQNKKIVMTTKGDMHINGRFEASEVVAGSFTVKNDGSNDTVGQITIPAGTKTVVVKSTIVTAKSKVFITPRTSTDKTIAVTSIKANESFMVELGSASATDIVVDYLIVGVE